MYAHGLRWIRPIVMLLLMLALPACIGASPTPVALQTATQRPTQTIARPPTRTARPATATPKPTEGPPLISGPDVTFQDVQFTLPTKLVSAVQAEVVPEMDRLGEIYPAYIEFTLVDYISQNTRLEPHILIYPVHELDQAATQTVQDLKDLLAEKPRDLPAGIPILPTIPASQLIDAHIQYLTFTNGSGVRVLTQLAQDAWPINNEGLVYIFQGLTSDDAYYISAFLPVTAPFLPDHVDDLATVPSVNGKSFPEFDSPNFGSEYRSYRQAIIDKLNSTAPEEFEPALGILDSLMESLKLELAPAPQESVRVPCVNALPTRLRVGAFAYVNPDPPLPNNLRSDAGSNSSLLGEIQPGDAMKILEGPKCADGWAWWKVRTLEPEMVGWTVEGDRQSYWLIPCESRNKCGPE